MSLQQPTKLLEVKCKLMFTADCISTCDLDIKVYILSVLLHNFVGNLDTILSMHSKQSLELRKGSSFMLKVVEAYESTNCGS